MPQSSIKSNLGSVICYFRKLYPHMKTCPLVVTAQHRPYAALINLIWFSSFYCSSLNDILTSFRPIVPPSNKLDLLSPCSSRADLLRFWEADKFLLYFILNRTFSNLFIFSLKHFECKCYLWTIWSFQRSSWNSLVLLFYT